MSEGNGVAPVMLPETTDRFAVVQTGFVGPDASIMVFALDDGTKVPQIVRIADDFDTANKLRKRLATQVGGVASYGAGQKFNITPIYGVMPIKTAGKKRTRTMTEEQKRAAGERLAKARKAGGKKS